MKNYKIAIAGVFAAILGSCNYTAPHELTPNGAFVMLDEINSAVIDFSDPSSAYEVVLRDPIGNVVSYDLSLTWTSGGVTSDTVDFNSYSSFPTTLKVTAADIAAALGVPTTDLNFGDRIDFIGTTTDAEGVVYTFNDLSGDLQANPAQGQAYAYTTYLSCAFDQSAAVGTYTITAEGFGVPIYDDQVDVVAGDNEGQIIATDIFGNPDITDDDVAFDVDLSTGIASVDPAPAWDTGDFGWPYGIASIDGSGFVFSCTGTITVLVQHRVALGTFGGGPYLLELTKN